MRALLRVDIVFDTRGFRYRTYEFFTFYLLKYQTSNVSSFLIYILNTDAKAAMHKYDHMYSGQHSIGITRKVFTGKPKSQSSCTKTLRANNSWTLYFTSNIVYYSATFFRRHAARHNLGITVFLEYCL
jgi:hypothetical protein